MGEKPCAQQAIAVHTRSAAPLPSPRRRALPLPRRLFPLAQVSLAPMDSNLLEMMSCAQQVNAPRRRAARPCHLLAPLSQRRQRLLVKASLVLRGWILFQEQPCAQQAIAARTHAAAPLPSPRCQALPSPQRRPLPSPRRQFSLVVVSLAPQGPQT